MIAEAGLAALWLAATLAGLQLLLAWSAVARGNADAARFIRPLAVAQGVLAGLAMALLIVLFLISDMSVYLVAANSHSLKPFIYKFAGAWGNHEGSMLLWVAVMSLAGGAVALFERSLDRATHFATLGAQAAISLGFYAFLLFASNPFQRLNPPAVEGQGLNPLLQDPGLAFHPPTLYFGYVGLSVAFSFAVGALLTRQVDARFARAIRPWVLGAWVLLTIGIAAGSYWAYYELGWGGWWFWDPVENASLMPWLAATALLHSASVLAARDALRAWTVMLAVVAFAMSMIGTFLVRSGILTSVHAFAVDPTRGSFILILLGLYIGGALALFAMRVHTVNEGARFDPLSREALLVVNNLLLCVILGLVLIGTLYPLLTEMLGQSVSVGPPYFNAVIGPITLVLMTALVVGPLLRWRRDESGAALRRSAPAIGAAVVTLIAVLLFADRPIGWLPLLGLVMAAAVAVASVAPLWKRNLRRTPMFTYGMVIAHLGCAVSLAGMASESAFSSERLAAAAPGDSFEIAGYTVTMEGVRPYAGPNWTAMEAQLVVRRGAKVIGTARPQARYFTDPPTPTNESIQLTRWNGQLYLVLGEALENGRWQLRIWWKPFVTLIWGGAGLIALGGALALVGRVRRERKQARLARASGAAAEHPQEALA
ncbi:MULTISPECIES: heme lyase CcmF/NrfE family subunit [unclassified Sphingobium]|uniref:heme lyase CcmF/NrfE family subunit n=1 Tax=unclassified Sphingobium TaxID=2611147 RepID=UPI002224154A|nr:MULTISPECIES: heme lyase CcmF/NrfE family subunit [unclassified Sphingobium]MCW2395137.1 cytochrome c-type biogenesis protein CcmF [Sphingobium sp. B8D3B]MCW2418651.1 cytochrome c-type biogenesis protein CcmF [Sphingobium sp. B8D3C]